MRSINADIDWSKPLLIQKRVERENTANLSRARANYPHSYNPNFFVYPYAPKFQQKIKSTEFPLEKWWAERKTGQKIGLAEIKNWIKERRDLFPEPNAAYYLHGYGLKPYRKRFKRKPHKKKRHKNNWRPLKAICSFMLDDSGEVYFYPKRKKRKGTRKLVYEKYLLWHWFKKGI